MKTALLVCLGLLAALDSAAAEEGFDPIFDGRTLAGWETPDLSYWTVEEGAITGRITKEHPCTVNQYLVWQGGELADFELKLSSRLTGEGGINNGFQFRSRLLPDHDVCGYQMDNNLQTPWLVRLYDEFGRHTLAMRGERTDFDPSGARQTAKLAEAGGAAWFRLEEWHEYHLVCLGPKITLRVNGRLAAEVKDLDLRRQELQGILALQLHSGPPTVVQFKDVRLKILKPAAKLAAPNLPESRPRRTALLGQAQAWWPLDSGGHGAQPPLRHIPGWEQFELNVKPGGPGARAGAKVVLLDGAYFDAGPALHPNGEQFTVLLRARDPQGRWNAGLFSKHGSFSLAGSDLPGTAGANVLFEIRTELGPARISFPADQFAAEAWHDLVGRYDGNTLSLFSDGKLRASQPHRGTVPRTEDSLLIGAEIDGGKAVRHFHGELEEAAIWPRALTDEEIALLSQQP